MPQLHLGPGSRGVWTGVHGFPPPPWEPRSPHFCTVGIIGPAFQACCKDPGGGGWPPAGTGTWKRAPHVPASRLLPTPQAGSLSTSISLRSGMQITFTSGGCAEGVWWEEASRQPTPGGGVLLSLHYTSAKSKGLCPPEVVSKML